MIARKVGRLGGGRELAGTIAAGQVADLVALDRDPFAGAPAEIGAAQVASTWVGGVRVYESTASTC